MPVLVKILLCVAVWMTLGAIGVFHIALSESLTDGYTMLDSFKYLIKDHSVFFLFTGPIIFVLGYAYIILNTLAPLYKEKRK